jgi:hypothetical protein
MDANLPSPLIEALNQAFPPEAAAGGRYAPQMMQLLNR